MTAIGEILGALAIRDLTREETTAAFRAMIDGTFGAVEIAAVLGGLLARGETAAEVAGAAEALRTAALPFPRPPYAYADTCGTGGDGAGTVNISTAVAFVAAELGVPVAKHGNRSVSSRCGSADLLETLGVRLDPAPEVARRCLDAIGLCFLFAPQYHQGVRHAMPVRRALGVRTLFNLLGPLTNPSTPPWQLLGVYDPRRCRLLAETLQLMGTETALVVHGGGLDEIAVHVPTTAVLLRDGVITELTLVPEEGGIGRHPLEALRGGGPAENAAWLQDLLAGRGAPAHVDAVSINAGAMAWIAGKAPNLAAGTALAREALQSGRARARLEQWKELSHGA